MVRVADELLLADINTIKGLCFLSVRNLVVQRGREVLRGSVVGKCCGQVL